MPKKPRHLFIISGANGVGKTTLAKEFLKEHKIEFLNADIIAGNLKAEIKQLNLIVSLYLDFAELQATNGRAMTMQDWIKKLDDFLRLSEKEILIGAGNISAEKAEGIADSELAKFRSTEDKKIVSDFDKVAKKIEREVKKKSKK